MKPNLAIRLTGGIFLYLLLGSGNLFSQCPQLFDGTGTPSSNPYWIYCFGTDFTLNIQSPDNIGNWTLDWGDGSAISSGASLVPPAVVSHTYTATIDTFVVTFTETSTGCVITGVVVMEEPANASIQIPFGGSTQACAPQILEFTNSSTDVSETTVFTWDFGDGSAPVVLDYTSAGQTVQHQYLPGTVNCNTTVTLSALNYCNVQQGGPSQASFNPVQVWDFDIAAVQASAVLLCYPDTSVTFENITTRNCLAQGNTFQRQELWNFGNHWGTGTDSIVGWQPWPPSLPVTIDFPGPGTYDIMLVDSNFCGLDTATISIDIVLPPDALFTLSDDTICAGDPATAFNNSGAGANAFDWNFGDGNGWQTTGPGDQTFSYPASGDYTIMLAANVAGGTPGCTDTFALDVHVLPSPVAAFNLSNAIGCDTLTVGFTDVSVDAITWDWDFDNGNTGSVQNPPPQFYGVTGNYNVSLTVNASNGCSSSVTEQIDVFQSPTVAFTPTAVCENSVSVFTDMSVSSPGDPLITWDWDFDDGNVSGLQNPTNIYTSTGNYDVILMVSTANCSSADTFPISVEPLPNAGFNTSILDGCTPLDVQFTNTSSGAVSYLWLFGDGDTATSADTNHVFVNATLTDTLYNVQMIAVTAFGCTDTAGTQINVFSGATAGFTHNGIPGCAPLAVDFTNTSTGAINYEWDFGDGNTSTLGNPSHTYVNTSFFLELDTVELVALSPNGCTDTITQVIAVYPIPDFSFNLTTDSGCSPLVVAFPAVVGAVTHNWDFGDGNTGSMPAPVHSFNNTTINDVVYTVELIASNAFGCVDTTYDSVLVYANPVAQFQPDAIVGCHPFTVDFQNLSVGAVDYNWDFDDGNTSIQQNVVHTFSNQTGASLFFDVLLTATSANGCVDTSLVVLETYPEIVAGFDSDTGGCSPFPVDFTNTSVNAVSFEWDFGDGIQDFTSNPGHTFINNSSAVQTFVVELVATSADGCTDTIVKNITVYPTPAAAFAANPPVQNFPSTTANVTNTTSNGPWDYLWDFDDGSTDNSQSPPSHTYATWGTYVISLIVSTPYCSDTAFQSIDILPIQPVAHFGGSGEGCSPLTIAFTDSSLYATSHSWDFGDGNTSTQQHPTYTYYASGTYTVTLVVTGDGGTDTAIHVDTVTVHPRATAYFSFFPSLVYVPNQAVQFYNLSANATSYTWIFGDGTIDTINTIPFHYYQEAGSYDITLIADTEYGCADTFFIPNAVTGEVGGTISFPSAFTPNEGGSNNGVYDPQSTDNDIFFPVFSGVDDYHLMIFNRWGELIFETFDTAVGWDGYYRGKPCQQDVYVWKVNVKFNDGTVLNDAGDLTLIR